MADVELKEKGDGYIRIGQPAGDQWMQDDEVCIVRDGDTVGCGPVSQSETDSAIVRVGGDSEQILPGDRVQSYLEIREENTKAIVSAGVMAGFGYYFPHLHLQYKVDENWYAGVMGSFSGNVEGNTDINSKGLFLTANSYSRRVPFRGFWFRAGAGAYMLKVTSSKGSESVTAPAVLSTVGWRGYIGPYLTTGVGMGLQYLPDQIKMVPLGLRDIEPLLTVDVGVRF
jgi:hypothetical protein